MAIQVYKNLVKTTAAALKRVFEDGQYAEQVLEKTLAGDKRLGSRDRKFIAEIFYDMVRFWRNLEILEERISIPSSDYFLKVCLWLGHKGYAIQDWPELQGWDFALLQQPITGESRKVLSYPDWLWEMGEKELPNRWPVECAALNESAPIYLRANGLKISANELLEVLRQEGVEAQPVEGHPDALKLSNRTNVIRLGSFRKGLYEVQDAASQCIAPFVQPEPGQLVIDACAGAGGKTLHLAALMGNQGKIVAMDVESWKLEELKKRATRNGVKIVATEWIKGNKTIKFWEKKADRVLLDAPCSGLGVLRRHPDSKWKLSEADYDEVKDTQAEILDSYSRMVKPGGKLIYATCSLMPGENQDQVQHFLAQNPDFELEDMQATWPSEGWDGFFMARMRRK